MLTEKENYLRAIKGEVPEWVPRNMYASPGHAPATAWIAPGILNERRTPTGGFDIWGVEYVTTKETGYMALPKPGEFILDDITKWRDVIKAPSLDGIDWEQMAKKDLERVDRSQTAVMSAIHVGYFQQLMNFMGFTEGLCAMIEEPEEVMALFEYMADFYGKINEKFAEYYKPDIWGITDDTATAKNPFISVEMYRDMVKPFHTRDAKYANEMGLPINMHDCGRCEDFIDDWLDFGVCCWNPAQTMNDLVGIKKKYGKPRKTQIIELGEDDIAEPVEEVENYGVFVVLTKEGYFKKTTLQSLMRADEQKLKDGDEIANSEECENVDEVVFFSDKGQCYKAKIADFDNVKASALGDYVAAKLKFDEDEKTVMMKAIKSYDENDSFIFIFENGKGVKIPVTAYETKSNRRKLTGAYSMASPIAAILYEHDPYDILIENSVGKGILVNTALIPQKTTRSSSGVTLFTMKKGITVTGVKYGAHLDMEKASRCRKNKLPATGVSLEKNPNEQLKFE